MAEAHRNIETIGYVVHGEKQDFVLEELIVDGPQEDELLIDMKFSGICHTDLVFQQGEIKVCPFPAVFGVGLAFSYIPSMHKSSNICYIATVEHEGAGYIRAIGPKVKDKSLKVGDFVLLSINYCEKCKFCLTGHPANCVKGTVLHLFGTRPDGSCSATLKRTGEPVRSFFFGQSSFMKTNCVAETCVVKYPYPAEGAAINAAMGCGYQTGAGTVMNVLKPTPDDSVVVFGLGTVGLTAIMGAKYLGVKKIIAIDIQALKLPIALEVGATHAVNSREVPDIVAHIKELTDGAGADFAVDCTGIPVVIENMLNCLAMFGTAATVGVPPTGAKVSVDPLQFLLYSKKYVGVREGDSLPPVYIPKLVEMQREGQFPVEKIVRVYDYKDMGKALHDLHEGTVVKPVIQWF